MSSRLASLFSKTEAMTTAVPVSVKGVSISISVLLVFRRLVNNRFM